MRHSAFISGLITGIAVASGAVWAANARNLAQEEQNLVIAVDFYETLLNEKNWEKGRSMMGNRYVQHNPNATDGYDGIEAHINMIRDRFPENHGEIKHMFTRDDLVALHVHSKRTPDSLGNAVVDMFRIEDGKVVEHWDVVQEVPETALNDNTMF